MLFLIAAPVLFLGAVATIEPGAVGWLLIDPLGRVAELVDALGSGPSGRIARGGSSPLSPTGTGWNLRFLGVSAPPKLQETTQFASGLRPRERRIFVVEMPSV